ncbi:recombinase RecJ [Kocuria sp. TGY1127_2]|uniref:recombinase RecJ n=1 Tax=Kocuria sp. TGY1127_2 TaxID=2711328 RepID=UPI0015B90003|nr:recombinase RecJ [Kocuria sp. TGY1127_2]
MYALIIDSPDSSVLANRLNSLPSADRYIQEFTVSSAGKLSAVFSAPEAALDAALATLRQPGVMVGLGTAGNASDQDAGTTLAYARAACDRCAAGPTQANAAFRNIAVEAPDPRLADAATGVARLLSRLVGTRTQAEWRVVDLLVPGVRGQHRAIADALGISPQAVSKALIRTGWHEQTEGYFALAEILRRLEGTAADTAQ